MNFNFCPNCGHAQTVARKDDTTYICRDCDWHFWNNPKAAVGVIILKDDTILIGERAKEPQKGKYDFPGGFVDYGEDPYEAATREVREETSIEIQNPEIIFVGTHTYMEGVTTVDLIMIAREWNGTPRPDDDVASLSWQPLSVLDSALFSWPWPGLSDIIKPYLP